MNIDADIDKKNIWFQNIIANKSKSNLKYSGNSKKEKDLVPERFNIK